MTTVTRRQAYGISPLPSSKNLVGVEGHAEAEIMENDDTAIVVSSTQRDELSLDRGAYESPASFVDAVQACGTKTNRVVGQQHSLNNSLKRRRSLPSCPAKESVPNRGNHFLHGISVDECQDLLSLPDPPSPPELYSKRRASHTFVPLRDLSNGDKKEILDSARNNCKSAMSKRSAGLLMQNQRPKRSRLSLPMMASPIVSKKKSTIFSAAKAGDRGDGSLPMNSRLSTITPPLDMAPPQNLFTGGRRNPESMSQSQNTRNASFSTFKAPEKAPDVYQIPTQPDTDALMKMRTLVHAYTALPQEERFESEHAKAIEAASGYPMVPSFVPAGAVSEDDKLVRRKHIIANLATRMGTVDGCKHRDARLMESVTQCRVTKLRGGYVEYAHIPSGRLVPPQEFGARYMCMIDEVSAVRSKSWGDYFAKLSQQINAKTAVKVTETEESMYSVEHSSADTKADSQDDEPCVCPAESGSEDDQAESSEDIEMIETTDSTSHESENEGLCAEVIYKTIDTQTQPEEATRTTPDEKPVRAPSPTSPDMLLPFPSRDQPSSDALIARAEKKLWNTIDTALATYSQEVLEIQAAAARKTK